MLVPGTLIGWVIMPIGILLTLWILKKRIAPHPATYFIFLGVSWALIAILCDYVLLVKLFKPVDGYYKIDVFMYYITTLLLPIIFGRKKVNEE